MTEALRPATHARHYAEKPQLTEGNGTRHWITRAANFVAVTSEAAATAVLARNNPDEYMVLLPPGVAAIAEAGGKRVETKGNALLIVPPGESAIRLEKGGQVIRIFSRYAEDLAAAAVNASIYADGAPEVAPLITWPEPVGGFKLRHYDLDAIESPDAHPLKMRVFRSTNLMVNVFMPWSVRRDEKRLSPHSHQDFEQMSLGLKGAFAHHLRYPWSPDRTSWREDEHARYDASPSTLVIPARVIHTTQDLGDGTTWLADVFSPPRMDFSQKPGFVINESEYPLPTATQ